jgi:hypothetical protein
VPTASWREKIAVSDDDVDAEIRGWPNSMARASRTFASGRWKDRAIGRIFTGCAGKTIDYALSQSAFSPSRLGPSPAPRRSPLRHNAPQDAGRALAHLAR